MVANWISNVLDKLKESTITHSSDTKKIEKKLSKNKDINVSSLSSKRYFGKGSNGHYVDDDATISMDEYAGNVEADVKSTAIAEVRYEPNEKNPKEGKCYVKYVDGNKWYEFDHMSPNQFKTFMNASSKGRYVNNVMRVNNRAAGYGTKGK